MSIIDQAPWITKQLAEWTVKDFICLRDRVESLLTDSSNPLHQVSGFEIPVTDSLISKVASLAGSMLSVVKDKAETALSMVPLVGRASGLQDHKEAVDFLVSDLRFRGDAPSSRSDWEIVLQALRHAKSISLFESEVWRPMEKSRNWPKWAFHGDSPELRVFHSILSRAVEVKEMAWAVDSLEAIKAATGAQVQDTRRGVIVSRIQKLAEELVDCKVVMELNE